jgi:hypothetical protein
MAAQPESARRWPLDFHLGWMAARALQTFFVVGSLPNAYLAWKSGDSLDLVSSLIMLVAVFAFFHRFATGEIDSQGIHYRRYIFSKNLPWQDIREIQWKGNRLIFVRKDKNILVRRLDFVLNPVTSSIPYFRHRQNLDTQLPPILERIHAFISDSPEIVSVPAQSRWIVRLFMTLTTLLVAIMLMRILLAAF